MKMVSTMLKQETSTRMSKWTTVMQSHPAQGTVICLILRRSTPSVVITGSMCTTRAVPVTQTTG